MFRSACESCWHELGDFVKDFLNSNFYISECREAKNKTLKTKIKFRFVTLQMLKYPNWNT